MSEALLVRSELAAPLRAVLGWMLACERAPGELICPFHKMEHTGKSAGAIVIACALARHDPAADGDELFQVARRIGLRLVQRLEREGDSTCFTFRPGRHDPYNCSNNVIDGGACSDALAELVRTFGSKLDSAEREACTHASVHHAQTYLRYAIMDKGIPAQKAWAMTGAAGAYSLSGHDVLELVIREGAALLAAAQHGDGSYPYHPAGAEPGHLGASDVSAFYQSRVTGFLLFALERAGLDPQAEPWGEALRLGLGFLLGLQGPDGRKVGAIEAKPWYWAGPYEVASHPFDTYALAAGWRVFRRQELALGARHSFESWRAHVAADGQVQDHKEGRGRSYQCPLFWAGHASWMARALPDLHRLWDRAAPPPGGTGAAGMLLSVQHFADADLLRLEDDEVVAWVRGARPPFNLHHGSPKGAGLLQVARRRDGELLLRRGHFGGRAEGEWSGAWGLPSPRRGWASAGSELRFGWWLARNAWRGGQWMEALGAMPKILLRGVVRGMSPRATGAFDRSPHLQLLDDGAVVDSRLALGDGSPIPGTGLLRHFRVDGDGLVVEEHVQAAARIRRMRYKLPAAARDVVRSEGRLSYRLR